MFDPPILPVSKDFFETDPHFCSQMNAKAFVESLMGEVYGDFCQEKKGCVLSTKIILFEGYNG